jgi:hypothetical protein
LRGRRNRHGQCSGQDERQHAKHMCVVHGAFIISSTPRTPRAPCMCPDPAYRRRDRKPTAGIVTVVSDAAARTTDDPGTCAPAVRSDDDRVRGPVRSLCGAAQRTVSAQSGRSLALAFFSQSGGSVSLLT